MRAELWRFEASLRKSIIVPPSRTVPPTRSYPLGTPPGVYNIVSTVQHRLLEQQGPLVLYKYNTILYSTRQHCLYNTKLYYCIHNAAGHFFVCFLIFGLSWETFSTFSSSYLSRLPTCLEFLPVSSSYRLTVSSAFVCCLLVFFVTALFRENHNFREDRTFPRSTCLLHVYYMSLRFTICFSTR